MKRGLLTLMLNYAIIVACAQPAQPWQHGRDSILRELSTMKEDSNRALSLMKFGWWWETYNMDSAAQCYIKMGRLSEKINYLEGSLKYYANYTFILNHKGKYAEGLALNMESVALARKKGSKTQLANCLFNTGSSYNNMGNFNDAIINYLEAASIFEAQKLLKNEAIAYSNIGGVFTNIDEYEKGYVYFQKALTIARQAGEPEQIASAVINAGIGATKTNRLAEGEKFLLEGLEISRHYDLTALEAQALIALAELYTNKSLPYKSIVYAQSALQAARQIGSAYNEVEALQALTQSYAKIKNHPETIRYATLGIETARRNRITRDLTKFYNFLAHARAETGNFRSGYDNLIISHNLKDSANQKEVTKKIEQLEIQYQTANKKKQILQLEHDQENQELLIVSLGAGIIFILFISFLVYKNLQNSKKIEAQKHALVENEMNHLKQSQQLVAAQSILQGGEEERNRLAKDLHDGLGGLLSGVKISLSNVRSKMTLSSDQVLVFERSLDMLDTSISELRRVAHNMMPEALSRFGLPSALRDYCESINSMKAMIISFQTVGTHRRLDASHEIILYRIVQELLNNILKHSGAQETLVQIVYETSVIGITVEDNGKGFEKSILQNNKGAGWSNIKSRVDYIKGSFDIDTNPGEGTSVHISIPL